MKKLSIRVKEIVNEYQTTTYKEVAERIIQDEIKSKKIINGRISSATKEEQNIKRRVYDALNVLIALGILRK